jgi:hypothetical protein
MVEKDVEYQIKDLILKVVDKNFITISNEFRSDGIVRFDNKPIAILEFKIKKNLQEEKYLAQIMVQALSYYYKLIQNEQIDYSKPFYILAGDDNEIGVIDLHKIPQTWLLNKKWDGVTPSKAFNDKELMDLTLSIIKVTNLIYYKYENIQELAFGFKILFDRK